MIINCCRCRNIFQLTHLCLVSHERDIGKQLRPTRHPFYLKKKKLSKLLRKQSPLGKIGLILFVFYLEYLSQIYIGSSSWGVCIVFALHIRAPFRIWPNYRKYPYKRRVKKIHVLRLQPVYVLLLYKGICCGYSFELHRLVDAIQMITHNICLYKENQKTHTYTYTHTHTHTHTHTSIIW